MKKVLCYFLVGMMLMTMLTGCGGQKESITIGADGKCIYQLTYFYEKSEYDKAMVDGDSSDLEVMIPFESGDFIKEVTTQNGKEYYAFKRVFSFDSVEALRQFLTNSDTYYNTFVSGVKDASLYEKESYSPPFSELTLTKDSCVGTLGENVQQLTLITGRESGATEEYRKKLADAGVLMEIALTLPSTITESNGKIQGNTVTWTLNDFSLDQKVIAATAANPLISSDKTPPIMKGVKNKKWYKDWPVITIMDQIGVQSVTINGKKHDSNMVFGYQDGKYTVVAKDYNGNQKKVMFHVDETDPQIKWKKKVYIKKSKNTWLAGYFYKNPTIKFSDNVKVKSVKINGKKQKNKKKYILKKPGKYKIVVTDKAGNTTKKTLRLKRGKFVAWEIYEITK